MLSGINAARVEGVTEQVGDIVLNCTGGTPTPAGQPIPLQNIELSLSTNITSRIVGEGNVSEALLLIDEPYPSSVINLPYAPPGAYNAQTQLACLANNSTNCSITGVGPGLGIAGSYNGSAGHYNVFQGVQDSASSISWTGVPLDAPGTAGIRVLRLTNIRANAAQVGVSSGFIPTQITAIVTVNGPEFVAVTIPAGGQIAAVINNGLISALPVSGAFSACAATSSTVAVTAKENFGTGFKPANYGQISSALAGTYTGPSASATDQNVPGFVYDSESAFRPDPAISGGTFLDPSSAVGSATQGTQIQLSIAGVGAGINVSVPSYVYLSGEYGDGAPLGVAVLAGQSAPAVVLAPTVGAPGPNVPLTVTGATATALYEMFYADPTVIETATVPVSVSYAAGVQPATSTVTVSFAPSASTDFPQFVQNESPMTLYTIAPCAIAPAPAVTSINPNNGDAASTVPVVITGTNFAAGATVSVLNPGVIVSNVNVVSPTSITASFAIALNAVTGPTEVTVTTSGGTSAPVSFYVYPPPPTLTSIRPNSGTVGSTVWVDLAGTNFAPGATVSVSNPGVTVGDVSVPDPFDIAAMFTIAANAVPGTASVTVTTSGGITQALPFTVTPAAPTVSSISPSSAGVGSTVQVSLTGTNFATGAAISVNNPGVTVSNVSVVSATQIAATFSIAASAAPGPATVSVTTPYGTSAPVRFTINPAPQITLSTASLMFSFIQGTATPPSQSFGVITTGGALNYSVSAASTSGNWLAASPATGQTPGNVTVSLQNLASLSAGTYQGTVTVQPQNTSNSPLTVAVSLQVIAAQPQISLSTTNLRYSVTAGSPAIAGFIQVSNTGGGSLNYWVSPGAASWLTITCGAQGTATSSSPGQICLQLNPATLAASTYFATLTVSTAGQQIPVNVTLQVTSSTSSILLSSTGMTFTTVAGSSSVTPASQTTAVLNAGQGTMNWTAQISGAPSWLAISPASGSSAAFGASQPAITFTPNPQGLAAGNYCAVVNVSVPDGSAANSPAAITVLLKVLPATSQVPPTVSASGLIFMAQAGGPAPATQQINLTNADQTAVSYSSTVATDDGAAWLSATPPTGSISVDGSSPIAVQVNPAGLAAGVYYGQVRLGYSNGTAESVDVVVFLTDPSNTQTATPSAERSQPKLSSSCSQYGIVFDQPVPTDGGTVIAGQQYTLRLQSLCVPTPPSDLNLEIDFSDGTGPLYPVFDSVSAEYEVTWTPTQAETVQLYARSNPVNAVGLSAQATETQPFSVTVAAPDTTGGPILGGVLNSASYANGNVAAVGSFISIFGNQFAATSSSAATVPFPTELGGVQATLAGIPLPLYYTGAAQVNAVVPFLPDQLLDAPQSLVVYRNGAASEMSLNVVLYQPGIFSTAANGQGQGAIQNGSYELVDSNHPASPGDTILIYCAGLGPVTNPPTAGAPASAGSTTTIIPNVYIDGIQAQVVYSGLSPGSVQLYQVNAIVPQGIQSGPVNVYLTVTDPRSNAVLQSNTVTIN